MYMFRSRLVLWGLVMNSWSSLSANPYRIRYGNSALASILSTSWGANSLSSSPFRGEMMSPGVLCGLHHKYIPIQVHPTSGKCTKSTPYVPEYSGKKQWGQQPSLDCRKTAQLLLDTCILRQVCMMIKNNNYHLACQRSSTHKMPNKNLEIQVIHDRSTYVYELLLPLRSSNSIHIIKYLFWEWLSTSLVIQGFTPTHCIDILWLLLALL